MARLVLFDNILNNNCMLPSKINGMRKNTQFKVGITHPKSNSKNEHAYPIKTPVHRAQRGNWYPNRKKLLSGFWWHPIAFLRLP